MLVLVACLLAVPRQDLDRKIDYTTRAKPLQSVLAELSAATKLELKCSAEASNEPVILRFKNVSTKDALESIAYVFGGEWKKTEKGFAFAYGSLADQRKANEARARVDELRAYIEGALKNPEIDHNASIYRKAQKNPTAEEVARAATRRETGNAILRIVRKLDLREICQPLTLIQSEQVVYSNFPNAYQKQLPECEKETDQFVRNYNSISASELVRDKLGAKVTEIEPAIDRPLGKILLKIYPYRGRGSGRASLTVFDEAGIEMADFSVNLGTTTYDFRRQREAEQRMRNKVSGGIPLGPVALELVPYIIRPILSNSRPISLSTQEMLTAPTKFEPLSFATSDVILGVAEQKNLNVACLPDDNCEAFAFIASRGRPVDMELFQMVLTRGSDMQITNENGWLKGYPADPYLARETRMPRLALERFVQAVSREGYVSLDAGSDLALAVGPAVNPLLARYAACATLRAEENVWFSTESWVGFALYGSLTDLQRQELSSGKLRLTTLNMTEQQTDLLETWLLSMYRLFPPPTKDRDPGTKKTLDAQPTEALVGGLGNSGYLDIELKSEPQFVFRPIKDGSLFPTDVEGLADVEFSSLARSEDYAYDLQSIMPVTAFALTIKVNLGNGYYADVLTETSKPNSSAPLPLKTIIKNLAPAQRQRYERKIAELRGQGVPAETQLNTPPPN